MCDTRETAEQVDPPEADGDRDTPLSPATEDRHPSTAPELQVPADGDAYDPAAGYGGHGDPPSPAEDRDPTDSEDSDQDLSENLEDEGLEDVRGMTQAPASPPPPPTPAL